MPSFKCLYYFSSSDVIVLEAKRTDLSDNASLSSIYHWLLIYPGTGKVTKLDFKSMGKKNGQEMRVFQQGEFQFNKTTGILKLSGNDFRLECKNHADVPNVIFKLVEAHLRSVC